MSKAFLISIFLVALASSTSMPKSEIPQNYNGVETFLASFMSSYTSTEYNMTGCLSPSVQAELDQFLAASLGYLLVLKFDDVLSMYKDFLFNLADACKVCGLNDVHSSLVAGLNQKGKIWFEVNFAFNFYKVENLLKEYVKAMQAHQIAQAGSTLGSITAILLPYIQTPPAALGSSQLAFNNQNYTLWWEGLIISLSINTKKQGPCARFLTQFAAQSANLASDISLLVDGNPAGLKTLFGDLASTLTVIQNNYTAPYCQFAILIDNIDELFTKEGPSTLITRYATRALTIDSAVGAVKVCSMNVYSCGQGFGTLVKYLLNWSIN